MSNKRYYWLKLNENFFEDDTIEWLEEQENGKDYVLFYLKLALKSLSEDGKLIRYVGEKLIPYDVKALAKLTNTSVDTVRVAMEVFKEIGLVSILGTGEIYLNQLNELIGSETDSARRMRKTRALENAEIKSISTDSHIVQHCDSDVQKCDTEIEIERELDIEIDKDNTIQTYPFILKNGNDFFMEKDLYDQLTITYKEIDISNEFKKMQTWLLANADKRKTVRGMPRFINSWLARANDRPQVEKANNEMPVYSKDTKMDQQEEEQLRNEIANMLKE